MKLLRHHPAVFAAEPIHFLNTFVEREAVPPCAAVASLHEIKQTIPPGHENISSTDTGFSGRADELRRDLRDDRVAGAAERAGAADVADFRLKRGFGLLVGASHSHAPGNPMSQRENAGFNAPRFSVCAGDESAAAPGRRSVPWPRPPFGPFWLHGVGHPTSATVLRLLSVLPAGLYSSVPGDPAIGVGQPASLATSFSGRALSFRSKLSIDAGAPFQSLAAGEGQAAIVATVRRFIPPCAACPAPVTSLLVGVGRPAAVACGSLAVSLRDPPQPLPDVRRPDARSAQIGGPDGISQCFQVRSNSGEPMPPKLARNLLSKDDCRRALGDEASKLGPEVALVRFGFLLPRRAEGLTGTASGPDGPLSPTREVERVVPTADAGEVMHAVKPRDIVGSEIGDGPVIDLPWRDMTSIH
jgi:hypothetical protein